MRILFIGPPGVGKGTQSKRLVEHLNIPHLSTGEMLRQAIADNTEIGKLSAAYMTSGKLVPDPIILEVMGRRLDRPDCHNGYLLDGFPRTLGQAAAFEEFLRHRGTPLDVALELVVDKDQIAKRLSSRGRVDDRPEVIRQRLEHYETQTAPLLKFYRERNLLREIDGMGTPDEVFNRIRAVVDDCCATSKKPV